MARPVIFNWPATSTTSIAAAQTTAGSGALVINGSLLDTASTDRGGPRRVILPGIQRVVSLTSTGNISGVTFTIVGTNLRGAAISEDIAGPNNNTVVTTAEYHTVTSIIASGAVLTATSLGTGGTGSTNWMIPDQWQAPFEVGIQGIITGTISFDVVYTLDDPQTVASPSTVVVASGLDDEVANAWGVQTTPCAGLRGIINSNTSGTLVLTFIQSGQ
jgi:hypothetical protein